MSIDAIPLLPYISEDEIPEKITLAKIATKINENKMVLVSFVSFMNSVSNIFFMIESLIDISGLVILI
tara:strand:+ start:524 stop:727 length:204 start_codon:yes stop_codon:yes gene_type:complete